VETFWYLVFVMFVLVPILVIWMGCVIDVIARPNMNFFKKALWVVAMLVFPLFGCLIYMIVRPKEVVVTEPGMYDELYGTGVNEFPRATSGNQLYTKM
jgi:hypothetical protein